ncbi:hypothetical protein [Roseomonas sp. AR75]|uniref:hypothetical protein n=1 Tax=Roseomonas sp. AR75 TaxID=2562311 RepID=UPI0010BFA325|nr:hypothetical protein [Roseomonas sp. AR75]
MSTQSDQRLFDALATLCRACASGEVPPTPGEDADPPTALDPEARGVLGEAALAVAFGAFAERGDAHGPMQALLAALGLLAVHAGEEPDPPAEILGIAAEDARVEAEVDRAGEALDSEFGRAADAATLTAALEARILGAAITLAGCTLPEGVEGQAAIRLRAARSLVRLAAGLVALNAVGAPGKGPG